MSGPHRDCPTRLAPIVRDWTPLREFLGFRTIRRSTAEAAPVHPHAKPVVLKHRLPPFRVHPRQSNCQTDSWAGIFEALEQVKQGNQSALFSSCCDIVRPGSVVRLGSVPRRERQVLLLQQVVETGLDHNPVRIRVRRILRPRHLHDREGRIRREQELLLGTLALEIAAQHVVDLPAHQGGHRWNLQGLVTARASAARGSRFRRE